MNFYLNLTEDLLFAVEVPPLMTCIAPLRFLLLQGQPVPTNEKSESNAPECVSVGGLGYKFGFVLHVHSQIAIEDLKRMRES